LFPLETRILVLDDMPTIRELVKNQLRALGYKSIQEGEDGEKGLAILGENLKLGTPIQLVISDWNMPKKSGLELLREVRAQKAWADLPFVLLTSESERDQVTEAILSGVSQYVVKPFAAKLFEEKLKTAWAKHNKA
jgi:two-component system chemotaxis response regulator CheY